MPTRDPLGHDWTRRIAAAAYHHLPLAAWMAAILVFSSNSFSAGSTGSALERFFQHWAPGLAARLTEAQLGLLNVVLRKLSHLTGYLILSVLAYRSFSRTPGRRGAPLYRRAFALAVLWAALDESLQARHSARTGAAADVLLDSAGAALGLALTWLLSPRQAGYTPPAARDRDPYR